MGIPLIWTADDRRRTLESYVQLYLREEIKAEALVRAANKQLGPVVVELPQAVRRIIVYAGVERLKTDDEIEVWPFAELARRLAQGALWP